MAKNEGESGIIWCKYVDEVFSGGSVTEVSIECKVDFTEV